MAQLYDKNNFQWIKINNTPLIGYRVVHIGSNAQERIIGVEQSAEITDNQFSGLNKSNYSFDITLFHVDNNDIPCTTSEEETQELNRILFTKEIATIEINGDVYHGVFSAGKSVITQNHSYFTFPFKSIYPYKFSPIQTEYREVTTSDVITIHNRSNGATSIPLEIEVEILEGVGIMNEGNVLLTNMETGEVFNVMGATLGNFTIYTDTKEIIGNENLFKLSNRNFKALQIGYGITRLKIDTRKARVKIKYQNVMAL